MTEREKILYVALALIAAWFFGFVAGGAGWPRLPKPEPDTNFVARMEFVAARLSREELQNSNNWAAMRTILLQIDQRLQALEGKVVWTNAPMPAPLQSAPQVPLENAKP